MNDALEVLVADRTLADLHILMDGLRDRVIVRLVNSDADPLTVIQRAMLEAKPVAALHLMGRGEFGGLRLGGRVINANLLMQRAEEIRSWRSLMHGEGEILIYGCHSGAGITGQALVATLSGLTGCTVAAASGLVGQSRQGGGWTLDVTSRPSPVIELAFRSEARDMYAHAL